MDQRQNISEAEENVARVTHILECTKNFLLRFTLLLTAPKLHLLSFCDKLSFLLIVAWTPCWIFSICFLNYVIFILTATTHHQCQYWRGGIYLPEGKRGLIFRRNPVQENTGKKYCRCAGLLRSNKNCNNINSNKAFNCVASCAWKSRRWLFLKLSSLRIQSK